MIGKRVLPEALWQRKQHARFHVVELPDDERIRHLCRVYAGFPSGQLAACVTAIRSRLGGTRAQATLEALASGDFAGACGIILCYYDRTYQTCLAGYPPAHITRHPFQKLAPHTIAAALIEFTRLPP